MAVIRLLCLAVLGLALTACTYVTTEVEALSTIPPDISPRTVYVTPGEGMDGNSLSWQQNARVVGGVLLGKGFTPVASRSGARLVAEFSYGIDDGELVTVPYMVPIQGIVGYRPVTRPGPNGTTIQDNVPIWGIVDYDYAMRTDIVFTAAVGITMKDSRTGKQVFEGRGVSYGGCPSFTPLATPMIAAVLGSFPAGRRESVTIEAEGGC